MINASPAPSENGHARPAVAAFGAATTTPAFGSQNIAMTGSVADCRIEATAHLLPRVLEQIRGDGQAVPAVSVESLTVSSFVPPLLVQLAACGPTTDEVSALSDALRIVSAAKQNYPQQSTAEIRQAVQSAVERVVSDVVAQIRRLSHSPLDELDAMGWELVQTFARVAPADQDSAAAIQRADRQLERVTETSAAASALCAADRDLLLAQLRDWGREGVRQALAALLADLVVQELRTQWPRLIRAAQALIDAAGEGLHCLDRLQRRGGEWIRERQQLLEQATCTTLLILPGTEPDEAVAGVLARHRLASRTELARQLRDHWTQRLRAHLAGRVDFDPASVGALSLLTAVPVSAAFALFAEVVADELQPEVLTVYGRLRHYGVAAAAHDLYRRAGLTCDPGPRTATKFNLNVCRVCLVDLPEVTRPDDETVRREFLDELRYLGAVEVHDLPAEFDEVVVHRVAVGWPWQILPSNAHLLKAYLAAGEAGHHVHLVDKFSASPEGEIIADYHGVPH